MRTCRHFSRLRRGKEIPTPALSDENESWRSLGYACFVFQPSSVFVEMLAQARDGGTMSTIRTSHAKSVRHRRRGGLRHAYIPVSVITLRRLPADCRYIAMASRAWPGNNRFSRLRQKGGSRLPPDCCPDTGRTIQRHFVNVRKCHVCRVFPMRPFLRPAAKKNTNARGCGIVPGGIRTARFMLIKSRLSETAIMS